MNNEIDKYIDSFPEDTKKYLLKLRATVVKSAPNAEEVISYKMPAYKMNGILLYFAAFKNHIGFYPTTSAINAFRKELSIYKGAKGSVQFPLDKPLPIVLISKIVKFRVTENFEKNKKGKN